MPYKVGVDEADVIRSRANSLVKRVGAVLAGKEPGTIVLEGERLIDDALRAGHTLEFVLLSQARAALASSFQKRGCVVWIVETALFERLGALKTSPGILALAPAPRECALDKLELDTRTLLLVAAGIADPGNLGALARSAEAFGASALLVTRGSASPWSDKALRGSMGSLLRLAVCSNLDSDDLARVLTERKVRSVCAATRGGVDPKSFDWRGPLALWIGAETGAMPLATDTFEQITIPIAKGVESLNVTVAASLLLYASGRSAPSSPPNSKSSTGGARG